MDDQSWRPRVPNIDYSPTHPCSGFTTVYFVDPYLTVANVKHAAKWQVNNIDRGSVEGETQFVASLFRIVA